MVFRPPSNVAAVAAVCLLAAASTAAADIHRAIRAADHDVIAAVLEADPAEANRRDPDGWPPLLVAAALDDIDAARALLEAGADPRGIAEIPNDTTYGFTALHLAVSRPMTQLLLEAGAEVNATDKLGTTPLHKACWLGTADQVRLLLDSKADPNAKAGIFSAEDPPIHQPAADGRADVVGLLLEGGADPNVADANGFMALHWSAARGQLDVCKLLLEAGADPNGAAKDGSTPLGMAVQAGREDVAALLRARGAR